MRTCLLFVSIFIFSTTNAQIKKGSTLLGGSLNFNHDDNSGSNAFYINIQYAKAYKDNTLFGFQLGYGHNKPINQHWNFYNGGVFSRKYLPIVKDLFLFGEANLNLGYAKMDATSFNPTATTVTQNYNASISLMPGLSYGINSKLHLEIAFPNIASVYYNHQKLTHTSVHGPFTTRSKSFGLNTSTQLNTFNNIQFGFRLLLAKRKG